jgi:hypothetical protein
MSPYRFPQLTSAVHAMLLRLSGRVPDDVISEARALLVAEDLGGLAAQVMATAVAQPVPLTGRDAELLAGILGEAGLDPGPLAQVARYAEEQMPAWAFAPASPGVLGVRGSDIGRCLDLTDARDRAIADMVDVRDAAMTDMVAETPGALGLWRTWRFPPEGRPGRRVYLLELAPGADPYLAALRGQITLAARGEADPQVEAYVSGSDLPLYQRTARARSALLWAPAPPRAFHRVRVYDAVDEAGPSFAADHPRMTGAAARERVLGHLAAGTVIRRNPALRDDVVDRTRRGAVPWKFVTDGEWIWSDAVAYYLRVHHLAPPADFLAHVYRAGPVPRSLDTVTAFRALTALDRAFLTAV